MNFESYATPQSVAQRLGLSRVRITQLMQENRLRFITTPLGRLITNESVNEFEASRQLAGRSHNGIKPRIEYR